MPQKRSRKTLGKGRWLRLVDESGWEFVERTNTTGIAVIVAVTDDREILLVEQFRTPVNANCIELPAGLVGDALGLGDESLIEGASREMFEETGYTAREFEVLAEGPPSAGQSTEIVTFILATGLEMKSAGGGVDSEEITRHLVPLRKVRSFLNRKLAEGAIIDAKLWGGLYFAVRR